MEGKIKLVPFECVTVGDYLDMVCLTFDRWTEVGQAANVHLINSLLKRTGPLQYHGRLWVGMEEKDEFESIAKEDVDNWDSFPDAHSYLFPDEEHKKDIEAYWANERRNAIYESPN